MPLTLKNKSGKYDFYIRAISDISDEFFKSSEMYSLWVFNTCYDDKFGNQMIYPDDQKVDVGSSHTYFKFLLFTCSNSSIPVAKYDFEYTVYDA